MKSGLKQKQNIICNHRSKCHLHLNAILCDVLYNTTQLVSVQLAARGVSKYLGPQVSYWHPPHEAVRSWLIFTLLPVHGGMLSCFPQIIWYHKDEMTEPMKWFRDLTSEIQYYALLHHNKHACPFVTDKYIYIYIYACIYSRLLFTNRLCISRRN